ncbi:MAG: hypothetical protein EOM26_13725 [Alphaproteobacteria bacterium]|nr:hypothetical protein [Alphaproteobacteria bacterium]
MGRNVAQGSDANLQCVTELTSADANRSSQSPDLPVGRRSKDRGSGWGTTLHVGKTRIVHVRQGFEFLGYKIKRRQRSLRLPAEKIRSGVRAGDLYAFPRAKSIQHFKDQIRRRTRRTAPVTTRELIAEINTVIRGWACTFARPTCADSSTDSTAGSCAVSGDAGRPARNPRPAAPARRRDSRLERRCGSPGD